MNNKTYVLKLSLNNITNSKIICTFAKNNK